MPRGARSNSRRGVTCQNPHSEGMPEDTCVKRFAFPKWSNYLLPLLVVGVLGGGAYVPVLLTYGLSARTLNVNYAPEQPVPYSHALHVGELGLDCRYCHNTVDRAAFAAIPPTETCINCHDPAEDSNGVRKSSAKLQALHKSYATGKPVPWIKVHSLPDFVYFDHSAHVNKGVSCVSCHSRVDKMEVVYQAKSLSMSWCLDCHRSPQDHLRPRDKVYDLDWSVLDDPRVKAQGFKAEQKQEAQQWLGTQLKNEYQIHSKAYMTSCSTCHR